MVKKTGRYVLIFLSLCSPAFNAQSGFSLIEDYMDKSRYYDQVDVDSSVAYGIKAYKLAQALKDNYMLSKTALSLGICYQNISDYKKATIYYQEGITLAEKLNDAKLLAQAYNSFGNLFALQKQYGQAVEYFEKALVKSKELNDKRKISVILSNLANIEYAKSYYSKEYTKTNALYKEAYEWAVLSQDTGQMISVNGNWGMSLGDEGNYQESVNKLQTAIALARKIRNESDMVFLVHDLARTYFTMKDFQKAIGLYKESLELSKAFKDKDFESENYYGLAISYYELADYKPAYDYFEKYKRLEDTLSSKDIANELNALKTKYDTENKQKQIELLEANANKDKITKISLSCGAVMLLLLAFLMFNRYRLKSKTNELLEQQNQVISEKNKDISDSINYAKRIQDAMLPGAEDIRAVFPESFILSIPKDVVSGDFYWVARHGSRKLFVVADCTGHGVPGALMSMIGNTLLNSIVSEKKIIAPHEILNELRREVISALRQGENSLNKDGMDLSLISLDTDTMVLEVACANNPVWILKKDGSLTEIKPDKQPIGYVTGKEAGFSLQRLQLGAGDVVYQFSDGYADQFGGPAGKKFKYNQLKESLLAMHGIPLEQQEKKLRDIFLAWRGNLDQLDDVLISGIRVNAS